jgi:hypothetical protein
MIRQTTNQKGELIMSEVKIKRREFVKRAAYAAPVILTLKAMPAFAASGSGSPRSSKGDPSDKKATKAPAKNEVQ